MTSYAVLRERLLWLISAAAIALLLLASQLDAVVTAVIAAALLIAGLAVAPVRRPVVLAAGLGIAVAILVGVALRTWN
jgi:hypothetical protein